MSSFFANAGRCTVHDSWHGPDKVEHLAAGTLIAGMVTGQTKDPLLGLAWGVGVGVLKEAVDTRLGECSLQDLVATTAGAALGATLGNWAITHYPGMTAITYSLNY